MDAIILMSLLQPAPEIFELFDDIILISEGQIVYHGPRENVLDFFKSCGFKCPERKGTADFLQEVLQTIKSSKQLGFSIQLEYYTSISSPILMVIGYLKEGSRAILGRQEATLSLHTSQVICIKIQVVSRRFAYGK